MVQPVSPSIVHRGPQGPATSSVPHTPLPGGYGHRPFILPLAKLGLGDSLPWSSPAPAPCNSGWPREAPPNPPTAGRSVPLGIVCGFPELSARESPLSDASPSLYHNVVPGPESPGRPLWGLVWHWHSQEAKAPPSLRVPGYGEMGRGRSH